MSGEGAVVGLTNFPFYNLCIFQRAISDTIFFLVASTDKSLYQLSQEYAIRSYVIENLFRFSLFYLDNTNKFKPKFFIPMSLIIKKII